MFEEATSTVINSCVGEQFSHVSDAATSPMSSLKNETSVMSSSTGFSYYATDYWELNGDPRANEHWIMSGGPWKVAAFTLAYCAIVFGGRIFMQKRTAYELRTPMLLYNLLLVGINAFFLYESLVWLRFGVRLFDYQFPASTDRSALMMRTSDMMVFYLWTKFVDYLDTIFFVFRKKNNQISILHLYHHISVPFFGWYTCWVSPTMPMNGLFALLNCFCHVIMYSYYALSSFGPTVAPYLWWKRYITQVQLVQFVIYTVYGITLLAWADKQYPFFAIMMPISQGVIFFSMFGNFYIQSYRNARKQRAIEKQKNETDLNGNIDTETSSTSVDSSEEIPLNKAKAE